MQPLRQDPRPLSRGLCKTLLFSSNASCSHPGMAIPPPPHLLRVAQPPQLPRGRRKAALPAPRAGGDNASPAWMLPEQGAQRGAGCCQLWSCRSSLKARGLGHTPVSLPQASPWDRKGPRRFKPDQTSFAPCYWPMALTEPHLEDQGDSARSPVSGPLRAMRATPREPCSSSTGLQAVP